MSLRQAPIDYPAVRQALLAAVRQCTGLDANHTVVAEPEQPNWPRPSRPYLTYKLTSPSIAAGQDALEAQPDDTWLSVGQRTAVASLNSYGTTHDEAYAVLSLVHAGLQAPDTLDGLRQAGLAVRQLGNVTDLSALLLTGYEGRAQMDVRLGLCSRLTQSIGTIAHVAILGLVQADAETLVVNQEL